MIYRKEIDGLRAIAVIPVVLYHIGSSLFSGGYVGVDVFFVISGYLITSLILSELEQSRFSLLTFYERRARRILPVLFVVMLSCYLPAWLWLIPMDMKDFAQSTLAVTIYASNFLFWRESGYFETAAEFKPLLHTWSLAVEEQFYLIFPFLLLLAWRRAQKHLISILTAGAVVSLALSQWSAVYNPVANFYLLPTRGWELAMGAISALLCSRDDRIDRHILVRNFCSVAGLVLILYSVFTYTDRTPFPSLYAIAPTGGAMLIILFGRPDTWIGKLLGNKLLVGIGLISYSLYLWHQPLFVFARQRSLTEPSRTLLFILSATAVGLAYLSWRYVEQPFRKKSNFNRASIFAMAGLGSCIFIALGVAGHVTEGQYMISGPSRMRRLEQRLHRTYGIHKDCDLGIGRPEHCATSTLPEVLLWGDSNAMQLMPALLSSRPGLRVAQFTRPVCGPILGIAPFGNDQPESFAQSCIEWNDEVMRWIKRNRSVRYVWLSSRLGQYEQVRLRDGNVISGKLVVLDYLRATLVALKQMGLTPVIVSPVPQDGRDIGRCLLRAEMYSAGRESCNLSADNPYPILPDAVEILRQIERDDKVLWLNEILCRDGFCRASAGDVLIYRDKGHLSYEGSEYVGKMFNFHQFMTAAGVPNAADPLSGTRRFGSISSRPW